MAVAPDKISEPVAVRSDVSEPMAVSSDVSKGGKSKPLSAITSPDSSNLPNHLQKLKAKKVNVNTPVSTFICLNFFCLKMKI